MTFDKYHSTGNDFLITTGPVEHASKVAIYACDRHFGIGADGILIAIPSETCDIKMVYYNSDGTEAPMCGNGLRAFTHYVYKEKLVSKTSFTVETLAGPIETHIHKDFDISIHLGAPIQILNYPHVSSMQETFNPVRIDLDVTSYKVYALFLGTLHGVVFVDDFDHDIVHLVGEKLCHHQIFPKYININFVKVIDSKNIEVQTYERGAGPTLSCGTGVSASAFVTSKLNLTNALVHVKVLGGHLSVEVKENDVILKGPTKHVATVNFKEVAIENI
jgi:diaminopimelate epimerase